MDILAKLFGSPARVRILRLFAFNPRSIYELSDVTERTKVTRAVARAELAAFEKIRLLKRKSFSREVPYRATVRRVRTTGWVINERFVYLSALQKFLSDTTPLEGNKVIKRLTGSGSIKLAIVSGVFMQNWDSRIDVLIVGDDIRQSVLERAIRNIEAELGIELRYAVFTTQDFNYRLSVYDKLIRDVLDYPHQTVIDRIGFTREEARFK